MTFNPVLAAMHRRQEIMEEENKMKQERTIPKDAAALIISRDGTLEYLDLQVLSPESEDTYLIEVANLAAELLEKEMFPAEDDEDDEDGFELDPSFLEGIDLGDDE